MKKKHLKKHSEKENKTTSNSQSSDSNSFSDKIHWFEGEKAYRIQMIIIFLFSFVIYFNTLWNEYALDDRLMIFENKFTKMGIKGIPKIMGNDALVGFFGKDQTLLPGGRYRPLSQVMFAIEYEFFGLNPFIGHLFQIVIFALLCVLIFVVLTKLFSEYKNKLWYFSIPFWVTLLFAAHPIHTEVVANIKSRDELLSMVGVFATMYFSIKYFENKKYLNLILGALCYILALFSKETAFTFFLIIPLSLYYFKNVKIKDIVKASIPMIVVVVVFLAIRLGVLGTKVMSYEEKELLNNPYYGSPLDKKYATIIYTLLIYIGLLFFPHPLTHDYYPKQIPIISFSDPRALISILFYCLLVYFAVKGFKKKTIISYAIWFYLISLSISSNIVFNIGTFINDRFIFAPSLGFCIIISFTLLYSLKKYLKDENMYKTIAMSVLILITFAFAVKTIARNPVWKNDFTLFTTDVLTSTNSAKVTVSAGGMYFEQSQKKYVQKEVIETLEDTLKRIGYKINYTRGDSVKVDSILKIVLLHKALPVLHKGITLYPQYTAGWILLGNSYLGLEDFGRSRQCYENALATAPMHKDAVNNLYCVVQNAINRKDYKNAYEANVKLMQMLPNDISYKFELARIYENTNQVDSAIIVLNKILEKKPDYFPALSKLGEIWGKIKNDINKSIYYLNEAYKLKPKDVSNIENMGIAYGIKGDFEKSIYYFNKVIELSPDKPEVYMNLSGTLKRRYDAKKNPEDLRKSQECIEKYKIMMQQKANKN